MSISPNSPVFYAQKLRAKDKTMRLLGLFQQAAPVFDRRFLTYLSHSLRSLCANLSSPAVKKSGVRRHSLLKLTGELLDPLLSNQGAIDYQEAIPSKKFL